MKRAIALIFTLLLSCSPETHEEQSDEWQLFYECREKAKERGEEEMMLDFFGRCFSKTYADKETCRNMALTIFCNDLLKATQKLDS
jgi:hypothetical protein